MFYAPQPIKLNLTIPAAPAPNPTPPSHNTPPHPATNRTAKQPAHPTNPASYNTIIMQNKPNFQNVKMNATSFIKKGYANECTFSPKKTNPICRGAALSPRRSPLRSRAGEAGSNPISRCGLFGAKTGIPALNTA
jgi:hypothetical protein